MGAFFQYGLIEDVSAAAIKANIGAGENVIQINLTRDMPLKKHFGSC